MNVADHGDNPRSSLRLWAVWNSLKGYFEVRHHMADQPKSAVHVPTLLSQFWNSLGWQKKLEVTYQIVKEQNHSAVLSAQQCWATYSSYALSDDKGVEEKIPPGRTPISGQLPDWDQM